MSELNYIYDGIYNDEIYNLYNNFDIDDFDNINDNIYLAMEDYFYAVE